MSDETASLPIHSLREAIVDRLTRENRLIVVAPTGSGKTTQLPQYLLDDPVCGGRKVVVLQPRRVAARAVCRRVCEERGTRLGQEVGYQVRFDDQTSRETRLIFMTEGVLLRYFQDSPELKDVGAVVLDEFHERSLNSDVVLGLVKRLQTEARPDLKLVVMSATLDTENVAEYLGDSPEQPCPVLASDGRTFPVKIVYAERKDHHPVWEQAAEVLDRVIRHSESGDVLIFMPGMYEIQATQRVLRERRWDRDLDILPLHGDLAPEQQDRVFQSGQQRRVIIATNVAESSITIDGVSVVIDGGLARVARFDPESGLNALRIEEISQASADQRAGRAGRTGPGICYRLWTESGQLNRLPQTTPEIQRTDLAEVVLQLHALGISQAAAFEWLDAPETLAIERAEWLLGQLGAFAEDADGRVGLSEIGKQMLRLPMEPRFARMLVEGAKRGTLERTALCAALVSGRGLLLKLRSGEQGQAEAREALIEDESSDFFTLMAAYRKVEEAGFDMGMCRSLGVHRQVALGVKSVHQQLCQLARGLTQRDEGPAEPERVAVLKSILAGFQDQLCQRESTGTLECRIVGGRRGTLARESVVRDHPLLVAGEIRTIASSRRGGLTLISLASAVEAEWIDEVHPGSVETREAYRYERSQKRVEGFATKCFGDLILSEQRLKEFDAERTGAALAEAWADGALNLPKRDHQVQQFIWRIALLAETQPEVGVQIIDADREKQLIGNALAGIRLAKEAQQCPLLPAYQKAMSAEVLEWLDVLFPQKLDWADEKPRKLVYQVPKKKTAKREIEVLLTLSITECFKLEEHPTVGDGQVPLTLVLTIPNGKEIGRTVDWPQFKRSEYTALKQRWKPKYPAVTWP